MFGKTLSEYIRFQGLVLALIVVAFVLRLTLAAPWASMNLIGLIGLVYYAVGVHLLGFGSYKQLLGLLVIQVALTHILIAAGIVIGVATGSENLFTRPEYYGGSDGRTLFHALLHLIIILILPSIFWLLGAPLLFVARMIKRPA